ncbi:MAG: iron chelate uptake ABC transporter family permease subunit, partial [Nocardioides sp.]|nr:iron chelate uptake ABC transporter family permease subunit [Nocardioides sp.]
MLVVAVVASMLVGARLVSPLDLWHHGSVGQGILETRLPRTVLGLLAGGALALAGACLQGLTRNPLADPGLLGVNAGATFAMVLAVSVLGLSSIHAYIWLALLGAGIAAVLVHLVASFGPGGATPAKLVLAGAALSAGALSWTDAV